MRKMESYHRTVRITSGPEDVFYALTREIEKWWGSVDQPVTQAGDIFRITFGEAFWTFRIIELRRFDRVSWECIESHQLIRGLAGVEQEWLGTTLHWSFHQKGEYVVEVDFVHQGLIPDFICYEVCSSAWDFFITDSLKRYLETGKGMPEIIR